MTDNYEKIVQKNLKKLYDPLPPDLDQRLGATREGNRFLFDAFGQPCTIGPDHIILGILISLYALHAGTDICVPAPFRAFKEFDDSMPYAGAFATHTELMLVPHVMSVKNRLEKISFTLNGENPPADTPGDIAFVVYPLPKIALCYILYEADEDFPAAVTCLYSSNAHRFMPIDGLADVGEYTSKKIIDLVT
jgi:hypothetical protein